MTDSILELGTHQRPVVFRVAGIPQPKGSTKAFARKGGGRPIVTSDNAKLKPWAQLVAAEAQHHVHALALAGVSVRLDFVLARPKSHPKRTTRPHCSKPDIDKLARGVLDALTGIAWADDSQVTRLWASKRYAALEEQPGVLVSLGAQEAE